MKLTQINLLKCELTFRSRVCSRASDPLRNTNVRGVIGTRSTEGNVRASSGPLLSLGTCPLLASHTPHIPLWRSGRYLIQEREQFENL